MAHIFISYAREDRAHADRLRNVLTKARKKTWIDTKALLYGQEITPNIDAALRRSKAVVVLLTPSSVISEAVAYEWAFAFGARIPVIPVLLKRAQLPFRFRTMLHIDLTKGTEDYVEVVHTLRRLLRPARAAAPSSPDPRGAQLDARFELIDGTPSRSGRSYDIWVGVKKAPQGTPKVQYKITGDDETFTENPWTVHAPQRHFGESINSWGDVYITARGKGTAGPWETTATLYEALRRHYRGRRVRQEILRALQDIKSH